MGVVATNVSIPLMEAATPMGISILRLAMPDFREIRSTMGMKMATTAVELITAPIIPTAPITSSTSQLSLFPP
ncbi:hypothetical protein D3C87_1435570 [compost metagenome]